MGYLGKHTLRLQSKTLSQRERGRGVGREGEGRGGEGEGRTERGGRERETPDWLLSHSPDFWSIQVTVPLESIHCDHSHVTIPVSINAE